MKVHLPSHTLNWKQNPDRPHLAFRSSLCVFSMFLLPAVMVMPLPSSLTRDVYNSAKRMVNYFVYKLMVKML